MPLRSDTEVLLNLELQSDGRSHFVELQVHHQLILKFNDAASLYRSISLMSLGGSYTKSLRLIAVNVVHVIPSISPNLVANVEAFTIKSLFYTGSMIGAFCKALIVWLPG